MKTVRLTGHFGKPDTTHGVSEPFARGPLSDSAAAENERSAERRRTLQSVTVRGVPPAPVNSLVPRAVADIGASSTGRARRSMAVQPRSSVPDTDRGLLAALAAIETAAARPALPATAAAHDHDESTQEVLRLPAAWYAEPAPTAAKTWSAEVKAGAIGLGAGLCLVVPVALFLGGWFGGASQPGLSQGNTAAASVAPAFADERPLVQVQSVRTQSIGGQAAPPALKPIKIVAEPEVILAEVRRSMTAGDIETARLLLAHPVSTGQGEALLLLGETFDPNVLAALGTRGVAADVGRARELYEAADKRGAAAAASRLKGLN